MEDNNHKSTDSPAWRGWAMLLILIIFFLSIDKIDQPFLFLLGSGLYGYKLILPTIVRVLHLFAFFYAIYRLEKYNFAPDERSFLKYLSNEAKDGLMPYFALILIFSMLIGRMNIPVNVDSVFLKDDLVFWSPYSYVLEKPRRQDVILGKPDSQETMAIILALPQDSVLIARDSVFINKKFVYINHASKPLVDTFLVLLDSNYLALNYNHSHKDFSDLLWNFHSNNIYGSAFFIASPISRMGFVNSNKILSASPEPRKKTDLRPLVETAKVMGITIVIFVLFFAATSIFRASNIFYILLTFALIYAAFIYIKNYYNFSTFYKILWPFLFYVFNISLFNFLKDRYRGFSTITLGLSWVVGFAPILPFLPFVGIYKLYKLWFPDENEQRTVIEALIHEGKYKLAIKKYKNLKNLEVNDLDKMAYCYEMIYDSINAIECRESILKVANYLENITGLLNLYGNYSQYGEKKLALLLLKNEIDGLAPDEITEVIRLSENKRSPDRKTAIQFRLLQEQSEPNNFENLRSIAKYFDEEDDINSALAYYQKIETRESLRPSEMEDVGYYFMQKGEHKNAIPYFETYLKSDQKSVIFKYLTECYEAIGDKGLKEKYLAYYYLLEFQGEMFAHCIQNVKYLPTKTFLEDYEKYNFSSLITKEDFFEIIKQNEVSCPEIALHQTHK